MFRRPEAGLAAELGWGGEFDDFADVFRRDGGSLSCHPLAGDGILKLV